MDLVALNQEGSWRGMWVLVLANTHAVDPITRALRREGDRTLAANSAHEAWDILAHSTQPITGAVVGLDRASGKGLELARDLREDYPHLNVVLLSHDPAPVDDTEFPLLVVPFSPDDVRAVLAV